MKNRGYKLEEIVEKEVRKAGLRIEKHKIVKDKKGNKYEIDLVIEDRFFIEVKYRSKSPVMLEDVARFVATLKMLGYSPYFAAMITNNYYSKRAETYGRRNKVQLYRLEQLNLLKGHILIVLGQYEKAIKEFGYQLLKSSVRKFLKMSAGGGI